MGIKEFGGKGEDNTYMPEKDSPAPQYLPLEKGGGKTSENLRWRGM